MEKTDIHEEILQTRRISASGKSLGAAVERLVQDVMAQGLDPMLHFIQVDKKDDIWEVDLYYDIEAG